VADTMREALAAAGLAETRPAPRSRRKSRRSAPILPPPRRELTRELNPTLRLELKAALTRRDLSGLVWISDHAVERFRERFEPESTIEEARFSLTARASRGKWHSARPPWVSLERGTGSYLPLENVGYLVAGEGDGEIVLPLAPTTTKSEPLGAVTCLYPTPPGSPSHDPEH